MTDTDIPLLNCNRGQAHTVEAILASLLILAALLFAIQTTAVTPFSSTTEDKHLENQQRETIRNAITITHENGAMKETTLNWNVSNNSYEGSPNDIDYYTDTTVNTPLITQLSDMLNTDKIVYNINVHYYNTTPNGKEIKTQRLLRVGSPSNNAITVTEPLTLHDTDSLTTGSQPNLEDLEQDEFYMDTVNTTTPTYNQAEIEVIAWRR